jgi:serine/threonine protein phosphatase PrpC
LTYIAFLFMKLIALSRTHVGKQRLLNEDSLAYAMGEGLRRWVVDGTHPDAQSSEGPVAVLLADGMGGAEAGEVASSLARETMQEHFAAALNPPPPDPDELIGRIRQGFLLAHDRIVSDAIANPRRKGMGTTLLAGLVHEGQAYVVWSGDSRLYRFLPGETDRNGKFHPPYLQLLTQDHSMVWQMVQQGELTAEEARLHPYSNVITQSLGDTQSRPRPDFLVVPLYELDVLLFCSDGLNGMLPDERIREICVRNSDLEVLADTLIGEANDAGGADNISLVLLRVEQGLPRPHLDDVALQDQVVTAGGAELVQAVRHKGPLPATGDTNAPGQRRKPWQRSWVWLAGVTLVLAVSVLWWQFRRDKEAREALIDRSVIPLDTIGAFGEELLGEDTASAPVSGVSRNTEAPFWQGRFDSLLQELHGFIGTLERDTLISRDSRETLWRETNALRNRVDEHMHKAVLKDLSGNAAKASHSEVRSIFEDLRSRYESLVRGAKPKNPRASKESATDDVPRDTSKRHENLESPDNGGHGPGATQSSKKDRQE